jgi:hypothetical protein
VVLRGLRGAGGVQGPLTAAPPAGPGVPSGPGWVWLQLVISPRPGGSQVPLRRAGYGGGRAQERDEEGSGGAARQRLANPARAYDCKMQVHVGGAEAAGGGRAGGCD